MTDWLKLAALVERHTAPDVAIDEAFALALGWTNEPVWGNPTWRKPGSTWSTAVVPKFTASVDAALTLIPEGHWLQFLGYRLNGWNCRVERQQLSVVAQAACGPALAICAAAARARAA